MNFSLGGVKRGFLVITTVLLLSVSLSACSGDDEPPAAISKTTATPDQAALDKAAIEDLYSRFWAAKTEAENNADASPERFAEILKGSVGERYLKRVRDYKKIEIIRTGEAEITSTQIELNGDSATVAACVNEDDWLFKKDGEALEQLVLGPKPAAAEVEKTGGNWYIVGLPEPAKGQKC